MRPARMLVLAAAVLLALAAPAVAAPATGSTGPGLRESAPAGAADAARCSPSARKTRYERHLDDIALLRFWTYEWSAVHELLRQAKGRERRTLKRRQRAMRRQVRKVGRRIRRRARAGARATTKARAAQSLGLSQEDIDGCLDDLIAGTETMLKENGQNVDEGQIAELVGHLATLRKLLDPAQNATVTDEQKEEILEDALVALVKQFGGEKGGELVGHADTLLDLLTDNLSEEQETAVFRQAVTALAKKIDNLNGGELASVVFDLMDVMRGDLSEEKRDELLRQHLTGFFTRIVGKGIVNSVYVKAFVTGYELMQPFADELVRNLSMLVNRNLANRCLLALERRATVEGLSWPDAGVQAGPFKNAGFFSGWTCASFTDPATGQIEIQAVSPNGGTVYLFDLQGRLTGASIR